MLSLRSTFFLVGLVTLASAAACAAPSSSSGESDLVGGDVPGQLPPGIVALHVECTAVKVGPREFLTAGHCVVRRAGTVDQKTLEPEGTFAKGEPMCVYPSPRVTAEGCVPLHIASTRLHESFAKYVETHAPSRLAPSVDVVDLALVKVEEDSEAIPIAQLADDAAPGRDVLMTGYGCTTREHRPEGDRVLRVGTSKIDSTNDRFHLTPSRDALPGGPEGCPGDSGGPLYVSSGGALQVAGINSFVMNDGVTGTARVDAASEGGRFVRELLGASSKGEGGGLPVGLADVSVAASGGLLMPGFSYSHEGVLAVLTPRYDAGQVISSTSIDGVRFVPGGTLPWPAGDVTGADVAGRRTLYLVTSAGFAASSLEGLQINPPVAVELAGSPVVPYWPQAVGLPDGRTLLTFVEPQKRAFVAVSDASGAKFEVKPFPTDVAGDLRGVLAHPGVTKNGSWVVTHQIADAQWMFSSFVQLSRDAGKTWSKPKNIQPEDPNIHDASVLTRTDEGADLYYLRASTPAGFNVHRRALHEDGSLGPEQLVTSAAVGHVEKPQARRLPDGRIALVFAIKRTERTFDVGVTILSSDAPAK